MSEPIKREAMHMSKGKAPLADLPWLALVWVAKVIQYGAWKYARNDWWKGMKWVEEISNSLERHFAKWILGEDIDDESGLPHLAHLATDILYLFTWTLIGVGVDDRMKVSKDLIKQAFDPMQNPFLKPKEEKVLEIPYQEEPSPQPQADYSKSRILFDKNLWPPDPETTINYPECDYCEDPEWPDCSECSYGPPSCCNAECEKK